MVSSSQSLLIDPDREIPEDCRDTVLEYIPILSYVPMRKMDKLTLTRVAAAVYALGLKHRQTWIVKLPYRLDSSSAIDLFRDYVAPDRVSIFHMNFYMWYPSFRGLKDLELLPILSEFERAVREQRNLNNPGYLSQEEREVVLYYAKNYSLEHPTVIVDPLSDFYKYTVGRLKHRGVFHLTDEVNGVLYACMTHLRKRILYISGRARELPQR